MLSYHEEEKQNNIIKLRALLEELPPFLQDFFRSIAQNTEIKTRIGYAYDLKIFFSYISQHHSSYKGTKLEKLTIDCLSVIQSEDIDKFIEYVTYYTRPDLLHPEHILEFQNNEKAKGRKIAAIRSMYKYFYKKKKVPSNPATLVDLPKIHQKKIVRLDVDEVANLLDEIENGENLTAKQKTSHVHLKLRDLALVSLLLGTGMRVSECVGINIKDIDFKNDGVVIIRKGGNQETLYFGDEVHEALENYLSERKKINTRIESDDAFFLSSQRTRISVRAVQLLVKKYSKIVVTTKRITPHKLRSTYGTNLYQETGDIYLVAEALGHTDINTTKKHYAEIEEHRRKSAAKFIKLRKD